VPCSYFYEIPRRWREAGAIRPFNAKELRADVRERSLLFLLLKLEGSRRLLPIAQGEVYN
jgi:hypothetical protein